MATPPFFRTGALMVLSLTGATALTHADTPPVAPPAPAANPTTILPSIIHRRGIANYLPVAPDQAGAPPWGGVVAGAPGQGPMPPRPPFLFTEPVLPKPTAEDGKKMLEVLRIEKAYKVPLDLTVEKATLEEIVAQIAKKIPAPAPKIEVRDAQPMRLSFALKNSTVGEALETTAVFAGVKLWVLSDHLLLAPSKAVTKAESDDMKVTGSSNVQRVFSSLIADELAAQSAKLTGGTPTQTDGLLPSAKTTFDKLSPEGKQMLQSMVDRVNEENRTRMMDGTPPEYIHGMRAAFVLSPETIVELNSMPGGVMSNGKSVDSLSITNNNPDTSIQSMNWETNGNSRGTRFQNPSPKSGASTPATPAVLDLSANKS